MYHGKCSSLWTKNTKKVILICKNLINMVQTLSNRRSCVTSCYDFFKIYFKDGLLRKLRLCREDRGLKIRRNLEFFKEFWFEWDWLRNFELSYMCFYIFWRQVDSVHVYSFRIQHMNVEYLNTHNGNLKNSKKIEEGRGVLVTWH